MREKVTRRRRRRSHLSEEAQWAWSAHGAFFPVKTAALYRNVGAQRAREPVTNATAVKPRVDSTKLQLQGEQTGSEGGHRSPQRPSR